MLVLLTNDDGIEAQGLLALKKELSRIAEVWVMAPEGEQSAISHSLTLNRPLEVKKVSKRTYSIKGTPTDAVMLGVYGILKKKPDMVISGINHGPNLGDDVTYSGTVAGAMEGLLMGIPSIAVSVLTLDSSYFTRGAEFIKRLVSFVHKNGLPENILLNVNLPAKKGKMDEYEITRLGKKRKRKVELKKINSRNRSFWWIGKENTSWFQTVGTDFSAVKRGKVSITPIHLDFTNHKMIDQIKKWKII
ncbi:MAG: 5'/3'-nucleotidase SurE [Candidatus Zixiibacteriota bacterium]